MYNIKWWFNWQSKFLCLCNVMLMQQKAQVQTNADSNGFFFFLFLSLFPFLKSNQSGSLKWTDVWLGVAKKKKNKKNREKQNQTTKRTEWMRVNRARIENGITTYTLIAYWEGTREFFIIFFPSSSSSSKYVWKSSWFFVESRRNL